MSRTSLPELRTGSGSAELVSAPVDNSQPLVRGLNIKAAESNSGMIYVGNAAVSTSTGYELSAGEELYLEIDDPAKVYVVTDHTVVQETKFSWVGM